MKQKRCLNIKINLNRILKLKKCCLSGLFLYYSSYTFVKTTFGPHISQCQGELFFLIGYCAEYDFKYVLDDVRQCHLSLGFLMTPPTAYVVFFKLRSEVLPIEEAGSDFTAFRTVVSDLHFANRFLAITAE